MRKTITKTELGTYTINRFTVIGFRKLRNNAHMLYFAYKHLGVEQIGTMWINSYSPNHEKIFYSGEIYEIKIKCKMYYFNDEPDRIIHDFLCPDYLINSWKSEKVNKYFDLFEEKSIEEIIKIGKSNSIFRTKMKIKHPIYYHPNANTKISIRHPNGDEIGDRIYLNFNTEFYQKRKIENGSKVECLVEVYTRFPSLDERHPKPTLFGINIIQKGGI